MFSFWGANNFAVKRNYEQQKESSLGFGCLPAFAISSVGRVRDYRSVRGGGGYQEVGGRGTVVVFHFECIAAVRPLQVGTARACVEVRRRVGGGYDVEHKRSAGPV